MRLPSLDRVVATAGHTARRFPLVLTCALVAAGAGMLLVDSADGDDLLERLLYASTLGLPLFVGITMLAERRDWSGPAVLFDSNFSIHSSNKRSLTRRAPLGRRTTNGSSLSWS